MRIVFTTLALLSISGLPISQITGAPQTEATKSTYPKMLKQQHPPLLSCKGLAPQRVKMDYTINTEGLPTDIRAEAGLPDPVRECAIQAIMGFRYLPATENGVPVQAIVHVTINIGQPQKHETPKQ